MAIVISNLGPCCYKRLADALRISRVAVNFSRLASLNIVTIISGQRHFVTAISHTSRNWCRAE